MFFPESQKTPLTSVEEEKTFHSVAQFYKEKVVTKISTLCPWFNLYDMKRY